MILAIMIIVIWICVGLYGISVENVENDSIVNIPFVIFLAWIPFFPWIFNLCGVM